MFGSIFLLTQYLQFVMGYSRSRPASALLPVGGHDARRRAARARGSSSGSARRSSSATGLALRRRRRSRSFATLPAHEHLATRATSLWRMVHHGDRHGARDGARDRVDHGLAAAREGRRRLGGERHDPPGRRRARRRDRRQRDVVGLRVRRSPTSFAAAGVPASPVAVAQGRPRAGARGRGAARRATSRRSSPTARNDAFVDGMHRGVLVGAARRVPRRDHRVRSGCRPRRRRRRAARYVDGTPGSGRARAGARRRPRRGGRDVVPEVRRPGRPAQRRGRPGDPRRRARRVRRARVRRA